MGTERIGKLSVGIEGDASGLESTLNKTEKGIKGFADRTKTGFTRDTDAFGDWLDESKKSFGKRSAIGETIEFFTKGAQVFAVNEIGNKFAEWTEILSKFSSGEGGTDKLLNNLARGLPIVGGYVKGWQNIFEMADGTASATAELNRTLKSQELTQKTLDSYRSVDFAFRSATAGDDLERSKLKNKMDLEEKQRGINTAIAALMPSDEEIQRRVERDNPGINNALNRSPLASMLFGLFGQDSPGKEHQVRAEGDLAKENSGQVNQLRSARDKLNKIIAADDLEAERRLNDRIVNMHRDFAMKRKTIDNSIMRDTAKDATGIWKAEYAQMSSDFLGTRQALLDSLNQDRSLPAAKRQQLIADVMATYSDARLASVSSAKKAIFDRQTFMERFGTGRSLEGFGGDLLGKLGFLQQLTGGQESPALRRAQYGLQTTMWRQGQLEQLYSVLNSQTATNDQKNLAGQLMGRVKNVSSLLMSPDIVDRATRGNFLGTQFANPNISTGNNFVGYSDALRQRMDASGLSRDVNGTRQTQIQQELLAVAKEIKQIVQSTNSVGANAPQPLFLPGAFPGF